MSARIIWACDRDGCAKTAEVIAALAIDGEIDGNDQWPPNGWGGLGRETLCPEHEEERMATFWAENPDAELFA